MTLGGIDSSYYTGPIYYIPISVQSYWQFQLTSIVIKGVAITTNVNAIADTGTTLIVGPYSAISSINSYIGAIRLTSAPTIWYLGSCSSRASMPGNFNRIFKTQWFDQETLIILLI